MKYFLCIIFILNIIAQGLSLPTTPFNYQQVKTDVVLILDGSDTVSNAQKDDIIAFLIEAFKPFDVDPDYMNIAIIVSLGDNFPVALVKNTFKSISSENGLRNALKNAYDNSEFASGTGQHSLQSAIKQLYSQDFLHRGYRSNIKNHLALYITSTNSPNQNAINEAQKVLQQNLFQFIAVGYQGGSNQQALSSFSGSSQCTIVSSNGQNISKTLSDKIEYANVNNGMFC